MDASTNRRGLVIKPPACPPPPPPQAPPAPCQLDGLEIDLETTKFDLSATKATQEDDRVLDSPTRPRSTNNYPDLVAEVYDQEQKSQKTRESFLLLSLFLGTLFLLYFLPTEL